ncbi:MAG TPA: DUF3793 family protein [Bacillota bacterium]|nr:DUF3793 family protein [Bacillota bacterium]
MLERLLITHCSPTLAGIKTGNLFQICFDSEDALRSELQDLSHKLNGKGILFEVLRMKNRTALILAYRPKRLEQDLAKRDIALFLRDFGYLESGLECAISRLKERIDAQAGFPHEIGLFLGYPLTDVIGFIENEGRNSKCTGCWKVYRDEGEAMKLFDRYKKCREVYSRMFAAGRSVMQLTVAA